MGDKSKIEWTEATWNPIAGCSLVSEGCRNCYAMRVAERLAGCGQAKYQGLTHRVNGHPVWTGEVRLDEAALELPPKWKRPRRIFVNSMSDLFHEKLTFPQICLVIQVMLDAPQHTYQILTKRADRLLEFFRSYHHNGSLRRGLDHGQLPPNLWFGVSCEDQPSADKRIRQLMAAPMLQVRFLSLEPLLGHIQLPLMDKGCPHPHLDGVSREGIGRTKVWVCRVCGGYCRFVPGSEGYNCVASGVDWVIAGGESGPDARPMHPDWARSLRDQCQAAGVPFFFKQWGEWEPSFHFPTQFEGVRPTTRCLQLAANGHVGYSQAEMEGHPRPGLMVRTGKVHAGRILDGRTWDEYPEVECSLNATT